MIYFKKINRSAQIPVRATKQAAGFDLSSIHKHVINPNETKMVNTGIAAEFPVGYYGTIKGRSSLAINQINCFNGTSKFFNATINTT
jgi:dUTP pyrophosphatase